MAIPALFKGRLALPVIGSPMFLASNTQLVTAQCQAGVAGCFPALNARPQAQLAEWIDEIASALDAHDETHPQTPSAPFGVNLILHKSNDRADADLQTLCEKKVPLVITSVGKPDKVVNAVHAYGGLVFHDVVSIHHARKAIEAGVDGLILVCSGAGGHGGTLSPIAFIAEVRRFWQGPIALAGAISTGDAIRAAEILGADFAYMGSRFLATQEAAAPEAHKAMMQADSCDDITYTDAYSGIHANYLTHSIEAATQTLAQANDDKALFNNLDDKLAANNSRKPKAWSEVWSAGQGIGAIASIPDVPTLVSQLVLEYRQALEQPGFPLRN